MPLNNVYMVDIHYVKPNKGLRSPVYTTVCHRVMVIKSVPYLVTDSILLSCISPPVAVPTKHIYEPLSMKTRDPSDLYADLHRKPSAEKPCEFLSYYQHIK